MLRWCMTISNNLPTLLKMHLLKMNVLQLSSELYSTQSLTFVIILIGFSEPKIDNIVFMNFVYN